MDQKKASTPFETISSRQKSLNSAISVSFNSTLTSPLPRPLVWTAEPLPLDLG